jgi:hypothetical protein
MHVRETSFSLPVAAPAAAAHAWRWWWSESSLEARVHRW